MAEARQAVAFQFVVTDEGIRLQVDKSAVRIVITTVGRGTVAQFQRIRTAFLKGIFPATPLSLAFFTGGTFALYYSGHDPLFGLARLTQSVPRAIGLPDSVWTNSLLLGCSLSLWTVSFYAQRFLLKVLLFYKGWMYDPRGRQSWKTKIWAVLVRLVAGNLLSSSPFLTSYQTSIPSLPVPKVKDTCKRYLQSVRPLMNDEEYAETEQLAKDFMRGPSRSLQWPLILKSWWSTNYVTDWWEKYVYLYWRGSIMINSNYYCCDMPKMNNDSRITRAALFCWTMMKMKQEIEEETLKPLIIRDLIPLCSHQYKRLFGTCRVPRKECDELLTFSPEESRHAVVRVKDRYYKLPLFHRQKLLSAAHIEHMLEAIIADADDNVPDEEKHLAALTAAKRTFWAEVREEYFSSGVNRQSMEVIEKAALVVVLDEEEYRMDSSDLDQYCSELLHGQGYKFWLDKSFNAIFFKNGRLGGNAEHSWADAPIISHALEYVSNWEYDVFYQDDGHNHGYQDADMREVPTPQQLKWDLTRPLCAKIEEALAEARESISNIDLRILSHDIFGKGLIKKCKVSPDAFIQLALQLSYYKDAGKFCLTYEASMTRLFREGRTETVRSCTVESSAFVKAMCDPSCSDEERRRLLVVAANKHVLAYKDAMIGKGVDRHLFCLYIVSRGKNIDSSFLSKVISEPWKLSTSQTPTQLTKRVDFDLQPERKSPGGGFGPVTEHGYGVSYIIPGDHLITFHVSSFKSSPHTDSHRFVSHIKESMLEMINLFGHHVSSNSQE